MPEPSSSSASSTALPAQADSVQPDVPQGESDLARPGRTESAQVGSDHAAIAAVDNAIRQRKTNKVMTDPEHCADRRRLWTQAHRSELATMIELAGWAPFHRRADESVHRSGSLCSPVPWRFYVIEGEQCTRLLSYLQTQAETHPDSPWVRAWQSKIKNMLAACGALVQITWLPDPAPEGSSADTAEFSMNNIEHVAAASAATQNLLLAAQVRGWQSYWSSGGILRDPAVFAWMGIDTHQALLGSVFLSPADMLDSTEAEIREIDGGLREQRGAVSDWTQWVGSETS